MKLSDFQRPKTVDEARKALRDLGAAALPLAGGTSLHFMQGTKDKVAVDISRLGLAGIKKARGGFTVGATTPIADLVRFHADGWALCQVGARMATNQVRNMSTVGGNVARVFPWADLPVALLALDGTMTVAAGSEKTVAVDEFFKGQPARLFQGGDLLTAVNVNAVGAGEGFGYVKEVRTAAGFSMATAAAKVTMKDGRIAAARVAVGAVVGMPQRLTALEKALVGAKVGEVAAIVAEATEGTAWKAKEGQGAEYTAHLARVTIADAVTMAAERAENGGRGGC